MGVKKYCWKVMTLGMDVKKVTILINLKHGNIDDLWNYLAEMEMLDNERIEVVDIFESD